MVKITFHGKRMTSSSQLRRELEKSMLAAVDRHIKSAAPPGVRVRKTSQGYTAEGSSEGVQRMLNRLSK